MRLMKSSYGVRVYLCRLVLRACAGKEQSSIIPPRRLISTPSWQGRLGGWPRPTAGRIAHHNPSIDAMAHRDTHPGGHFAGQAGNPKLEFKSRGGKCAHTLKA